MTFVEIVLEGTLVIGLCGAAGAGKNAVADILTRLHGLKQVSFAETLRKEVSWITREGGRIPTELYMDPRVPVRIKAELAARLYIGSLLSLDPWKKPTSKFMRRLLQLYGTEFRRALCSDYWVDSLKTEGDCVITDVRFPNETVRADYLILVYRPGVSDRPMSHASETILRNVKTSGQIINDGSMEDLERKTRYVFSGLLERHHSCCTTELQAR